MSQGICYLHSHSALERDMRIPKHVVLVDTKYADLFDSEKTKEYHVKRDGKVESFLLVPIMDFVQMNGVFKNLQR